ncbi:MAG: hypothetical protein JNK04_15890 [Myxococcales bacterium]|nr:hypothetical protein [Myxococcales bacterium]
MLDIIGIALFARSRGKIAEQKAQPAGTYIALTVGLGFGGEIVGVGAGIAVEGSVGGIAIVLALLGALVGCAIAAVIVDRLPDIRDPDRVGPSSMKVQIAGSTCAMCQGNIPTALDGAACHRCGDVVHLTCGPAHDEAKHAQTSDYRSNAKKKKKKPTKADANEASSA